MVATIVAYIAKQAFCVVTMLSYYPDVEIVGQAPVGDLLLLDARERVVGHSCPTCGSDRDRHSAHGSTLIELPDAPVAGLALLFRLIRPRWLCRACGTTFVSTGALADPEFRMTTRLRQHIQAQLARRSIHDLALQLPVAEKVIRRIAKSAAARAVGGVVPRARGARVVVDGDARCEYCLGLYDRSDVETVQAVRRGRRRKWQACSRCREVGALEWGGWSATGAGGSSRA